MEPIELVLVALATFAGAMLQSATGFGFALIAGPATFAVLTPGEAIATLIALGTVLNILIMAGERRAPSVERRDLAVVLSWAAPGIVAGILILVALSKPTLQVIVGIVILGAVAVQLRRERGASVGTSPSAAAVAGFTAGTLTTTTATAGPPLVLYLERGGVTPEEFRDSMAALLLGLNVMGAVALVVAGEHVELPPVAALGLLVLCVVAGGVAGRRIFERLDPDTFRTAGLALIVVSALASIVAGMAA